VTRLRQASARQAGDGSEFTPHVSRFRLASGLPSTNASRMENPDQFRELFRMQKALNERIGVKTGGMSEEDQTKWILFKSTSKHALERKVR
jgi:hypothetical protein